MFERKTVNLRFTLVKWFNPIVNLFTTDFFWQTKHFFATTLNNRKKFLSKLKEKQLHFRKKRNSKCRKRTPTEYVTRAELGETWSRSYQTFFLCKQRIFLFYATKLGRCTVHTF